MHSQEAKDPAASPTYVICIYIYSTSVEAELGRYRYKYGYNTGTHIGKCGKDAGIDGIQIQM